MSQHASCGSSPPKSECNFHPKSARSVDWALNCSHCQFATGVAIRQHAYAPIPIRYMFVHKGRCCITCFGKSTTDFHYFPDDAIFCYRSLHEIILFSYQLPGMSITRKTRRVGFFRRTQRNRFALVKQRDCCLGGIAFERNEAVCRPVSASSIFWIITLGVVRNFDYIWSINIILHVKTLSHLRREFAIVPV